MRMTQFPFPRVWIAGDLGDYRPCESTYCRYDCQSLPPLPADPLNGSYSWLEYQPSPLAFDKRFAKEWDSKAVGSWKECWDVVRPRLIAHANQCGAAIPDTFMTFFSNVELVTRMRSPTACFFRASDQLISFPSAHGGHFIHFLSDSQNCYEWYLYIDPRQRHCVVASIEDLADSALPAQFWENDRGEIVACESTFESFILRLWMENEIWFRLVEHDQPLTREMTEYLNHYHA
jgi:hypothetical protein